MPINAPYAGPDDLPAEIAVFPLEGAILLPRAELPLNIFEPRYLAMVERAIAGDRLIGMIQPDESRPDVERGPALFRVGCLGRLTQFAETGDGRYVITLTGVARFRVLREIASDAPYRFCAVDYAPFAQDFTQGECGPDKREAVVDALRRFAEARGFQVDWSGVEQAHSEALINALAMMAPFGPAEKQALVEAASVADRADALVAMADMALVQTPAGAGKPALQ
jgi:hypothetical protein